MKCLTRASHSSANKFASTGETRETVGLEDEAIVGLVSEEMGGAYWNEMGGGRRRSEQEFNREQTRPIALGHVTMWTPIILHAKIDERPLPRSRPMSPSKPVDTGGQPRGRLTQGILWNCKSSAHIAITAHT